MAELEQNYLTPDVTLATEQVPSQASPKPSSPSEDTVLQAALKLLPACQRCRRLRRKCDPSLPICRQCRKSNSECCFYDHSLQQILPRSYVKSLIDRLQLLKQGASPNVAGLVEADDNRPPVPLTRTSPESETIQLQSTMEKRLTQTRSRDDHYLVSTASGPKTRYFGRSSVFSLTVEILARAQDEYLLPQATINTVPAIVGGPQDFSERCVFPFTEDLIRSSIDLYMLSLNTIYPFLNPTVIQESIAIFWEIQSTNREPSTRDERFGFFRIAMMMAVAFASRSRHNPSWIVYDNACHLLAVKCIETVTSEISVESLQALMLLIIYCLFRPRKGDIWKLLDYACRLSIELGYHTEQVQAENDQSDQETRRSTFWSLYTIERIVGQIFGRPSDLPETIFTTKYPDVAGNVELEDETLAQKFSAAHHYRLVYIRSEVYKEIYLPSSPPELPLEWYESRLGPILDWYRQTKTTKPEEHLEGVGTITCSVAFHSTVIFVFQPLILQLLQRTQDKTETFSSDGVFPEDSFYSACRLIQVYYRVIRAPENSALGAYPMTFMSAHYCWIAAMTIVAHCILLLDGRLTPKRVISDPRMLQETANISIAKIFDISSSCLTLLLFCAEHWPGMVGMVDLYNSLSSSILPKIIKLGTI